MTARLSLSHGNGGRLMRELIERYFAANLANPHLDTEADAVCVPQLEGRDMMMTTDGFTVAPLEYPGGDIGSLAVHGTVNDLAVGGADPAYLTLNAFLEEGLPLELLERIVRSIAAAAEEAGARIVAGDTKVLSRGECGGIYLATTGVGFRPRGLRLGMREIRPGDAILVSGSIGDHGAAVMLAREEFGWHGDLQSDSASVLPICQALRELPGLRFLRDPTRGGLATVLNDIARATECGVRIREADVPVSESVAGVCETLGFEPFYLASEGRVVTVVDPEHADAALAAMRQSGAAPDPRLIGFLASDTTGVIMETVLGGERILDELEDDPLPRIC
ncbi:MAG: hydrogenase expression/formation protein HypE [Xanthomonadales bacterium]|nr:hydrogenase expression/formation protein HypE [Xanthomonadales bacterium]